ncbi:uncharacterized protein TEOVI_000298900 [Trypanosoma equiperdum]|uniref:Prefoldin subunit n=2 Tax=Trypanozoon TaxID=39700 RepID=Q585S1_TRYB2|nr:hypothetical protein, conserved [Trypanosoma brucei brucei TREU927]AAQ15630.1 hypothetical protein, conserved [Trypanosoma brucei brucei TREU927]AAX79539.1 hypothetical protein, conserved [Trypanosoma brucei]SCU71408.1 hypothetical protein, conserved [Trypanosoma equiperdum]
MDSNVTYAAQLESAAEEVAEAKQYLIKLDRRQHQLKEASRALKKTPVLGDVWLLCSGGVFVRSELKYEDTLRYLSWKMGAGERDIEDCRDALKRKVAYLAELEGPDNAIAKLYEGFELTPVN